MNQAYQTKIIYKFEQEAFKFHEFAKMRSIQELRDIAMKIWNHSNRRKKRELEIVCGKGLKYNGRYLSYCQELSRSKVRIVLARNQRDIVTLIHEIVHAQGYGDHCKKFVKKVLFYLEFMGYDRSELRSLAKQYKLFNGV